MTIDYIVYIKSMVEPTLCSFGPKEICPFTLYYCGNQLCCIVVLWHGSWLNRIPEPNKSSKLIKSIALIAIRCLLIFHI